MGRLKQKLNALYYPRKESQPLPGIVMVEPTNACNLKCSMCYVQQNAAKRDFLSLADFTKIIGQFPRIKELIFCGIGEPLLNQELFAMIELARKRDIAFINMVTNGKLLNEEIAGKLVNSGIDSIQISIHSFDPQTFSQIRNEDQANLETLKQNIKRLVALKKSLAGRLKICCNAVVNRLNYQSLPEFLDQANDLGIDKVEFIQMITAGDKLSSLNAPLKQMPAIARKLRRLARNLNIELSFLSGNYYGRCYQLWDFMMIHADGKISPCNGIFPTENIGLGSILEKPAEEIWNCRKYQQLRERLKRGRLEYCRYCECGYCLEGKDPRWFKNYYLRPLKRLIPQSLRKNAKRKKRILFIHPALNSGGAEDLRLIALNYLSKNNNYDITVCCIERLGALGKIIKQMGIKVICLHKASAPYNIFATLSLWFYLLRNRFDMVQTSLFNANFHGRIAAVLAGVKIIICEEHSEHYQYNSLKFLPYIWADRILSAFTDRIICCSKNLMDSIARLERIPEKKFFALVNTFNIDKLKINTDGEALKRKLGLGDNDLIISNVASLCRRKGQDILIRAFKRVCDQFNSVKLIFIGSESREFKQQLIALIKELGLEDKVLFLGRRDNLGDYLNISDLFVLSSRFEGLPLAMLEAMYMQVAAVAPELGGIPEVIRHGQNGLLVPPDNSETLATAVIGLLSDREKRQRFGREGRKTVLEQFNSERYLSRLEGLYTELLANGKSPR